MIDDELVSKGIDCLIKNLGYSEANELVDSVINLHNSLYKHLDDIRVMDLAGTTFVITGKLNTFKNRDEAKTAIEAKGGKVASTVSGNTNYLVNNDINSNSSKNVKAKQLGIPIIDEETLIAML